MKDGGGKRSRKGEDEEVKKRKRKGSGGWEWVFVPPRGYSERTGPLTGVPTRT